MVEYDLPSLKASIDAILNPDETEKEDINP